VADRAALSIRRAELHEREHEIAVELQRGLLPKELPTVPGVRLTAHYEAAGVGAEAGGDWYDAFALSRGRVGVVVGDVTGKGIPAASAMGQLRSVTRAFALADDGRRSPGEVLTRLNEHQLTLGLDELFTVVYAIIDPAQNTLWWANAGHPPPLIRSASGETRFLEGGDGLTGMGEVMYEDQQAALVKGSTLILYTDGLVERRGESLDEGLERLADAARTGPTQADALREHLFDAVMMPESERSDDVTLVVVRVG
jgi:serine phosphatase RsbU (regulator of sigma subunit)